MNDHRALLLVFTNDRSGATLSMSWICQTYAAFLFVPTVNHRFAGSDSGEATLHVFQVCVTTDEQGCKIAGQIRCDIVTCLPTGSELAIAKIGQLQKYKLRNKTEYVYRLC